MAQPPVFRERTEELERASLSTWATLALETKGRDRYEHEDPLRTVFQADRDRILASAHWAALADKSACLPRRAGRTRLAETIEVVEVARTIARALRLNEDLTEAVALGHALGSTPFSAAGEEGIALAVGAPFRLQEQALRVVEGLTADDADLNLTWETRDGMLHQSWDGPAPATLEGDVARFARRIVEVAHCLEDAAVLGAPLDGDLAGAAAVHERVRRWTADVTTVSWDRPQVAFSAHVREGQERAHAAARVAVVGSSATASSTARAVHCVASLGVFLLEGGVVGADHQPRDAAAVVDLLAGATDSALLGRYRAAFEPVV